MASLIRLCNIQPTASAMKERDEAPGFSHPGAMCSKDWISISVGTCGSANGVSIGVAYLCVPTEGPTQVMVETVGTGD